MGASHIGEREVNLFPVPPYQIEKGRLSLLCPTPFPEMEVYGIPTIDLFPAEEMAHGQKSTLTTALELIRNGVDNLHRIIFVTKKRSRIRKDWA